MEAKLNLVNDVRNKVIFVCRAVFAEHNKRIGEPDEVVFTKILTLTTMKCIFCSKTGKSRKLRGL